MCELLLVGPSKLYEEQVMSYKEEMLQNGDSFDGYASEMLGLVLSVCHKFGESRLLLTYDKGNAVSKEHLSKTAECWKACFSE